MTKLTTICQDCGFKYGVGVTSAKRPEWETAVCDKCGDLKRCTDASHWGLGK